MGRELHYQALPQDCGLAELSHQLMRLGSSFASDAVFVRHFLQSIAYQYQSESARAVVAYHTIHDQNSIWTWCTKIIRVCPGLETRNLYIGKDFAWLIYVLSPETRKRTGRPRPNPDDPSSWNDPASRFEAAISRTLFTPPDLVPGLSGRHGGKIGWLDRDTISDMAVHASSIEGKQVMDYLRELVADGKMHSGSIAQCVKTFWEFRDFFVAAAEAADSVLMIHD